jgi:cell division protein FtsN
MNRQMLASALLLTAALAIGGCSREQSDWEKAHNDNTAESYELFVKKYPTGTFTGQAEARLKELSEERDWQKARDADTVEAYQAFLQQYPEGKWAREARIRVENFNLAQAPSGTPAPTSSEAAAGAAGTPPPEAGSQPSAAAVGPPTKPPAASATPPKPAAAPRAATAPSKAGYVIQLGAFRSGSKAAERRWAALEKEYPAVLKGLSPTVHTTKTKTGTLYRLQVKGLARPAAETVCKRLGRHKEPCVVLPRALATLPPPPASARGGELAQNERVLLRDLPVALESA